MKGFAPATDPNNSRRIKPVTPAAAAFQEEIEYFGARVLPLVREIEAAEQGSVGAPVLASA